MTKESRCYNAGRQAAIVMDKKTSDNFRHLVIEAIQEVVVPALDTIEEDLLVVVSTVNTAEIEARSAHPKREETDGVGWKMYRKWMLDRTEFASRGDLFAKEQDTIRILLTEQGLDYTHDYPPRQWDGR